MLFGLVLDRLDAGESPADALAAVVREVLDVTTGRINLLLTDGASIAATRSGRSLFVRGSTVCLGAARRRPGVARGVGGRGRARAGRGRGRGRDGGAQP